MGRCGQRRIDRGDDGIIIIAISRILGLELLHLLVLCYLYTCHRLYVYSFLFLSPKMLSRLDSKHGITYWHS